MIEDLIRSNRSCRRFFESEAISLETLRWLVNLARLSASAANLQPLRYILSNEPRKNQAIFSCLAWAGYLQNWPGPAAGERPAAYLVLVGDKQRAATLPTDVGIAAQSILLGAREKGLAGCMIGSIKKDQLRESLNISDEFDIVLVIALGKPKETVVLEEVGPDGDIKYWRDDQGIHHVPKRRLRDLILSE